MLMEFAGHRAEQAPTTTLDEDPGRVAPESGISRRMLLRFGSGTAVIAGIGLAGMLEVLENREAIAAGMVLGIHGFTREPDEEDETPHRHSFSAVFRVTSVNPTAIMGDVSGHTGRVISTGAEREDQHFHRIEGTDVALETLILSGTEDDEPGEHAHLLSLE
jgi:hypothetical protein